MYIRTSVYIFIHMYTFLITIVPLSVYVLVHVTYIRVMKTPVSSAGDTPLEALEGSPGYQVIRHEGAKEGSRGPQYAKQRRITEREKRTNRKTSEGGGERKGKTNGGGKKERREKRNEENDRKEKRTKRKTNGGRKRNASKTNEQTNIRRNNHYSYSLVMKANDKLFRMIIYRRYAMTCSGTRLTQNVPKESGILDSKHRHPSYANMSSKVLLVCCEYSSPRWFKDTVHATRGVDHAM